MKTSIEIDAEKKIAHIDERMYSSFIEHMGRAVYTGIYEPDHTLADSDGFRSDVQKHIQDLHISHIRYPGGNFLSGYQWEDGIGPRSERPVRRDLAWSAIEPNWVGINEFVGYCKRNNIEPMIGVNLGTKGPQDAVNLLEYCNIKSGSYYSDLRRSHGFEEPYGIHLWCLGNEMDGPWQICAKTAEEYGRIACETAKMMKWADPSIELVACGSSFQGMPTFGEWEKTVLHHCWEYIDYLSLHQYFQNVEKDIPNFLAKNKEMESFIQKVAAICAEEKKRRLSDHDVFLSFDEWNVWYHFKQSEINPEKWICPRPIEEEVYDFTDALLIGSILTTLINNSDVVKIACLAQLVNVIAPIMTRPNGKSWLQTTYFPFKFTSVHGRGFAIKPNIICPNYKCPSSDKTPYIDCAVILSDDKQHLSIIIINKNLEELTDCKISVSNIHITGPATHIELEAALDAVNSETNSPVAPVERQLDVFSENNILCSLKASSWNILIVPVKE